MTTRRHVVLVAPDLHHGEYWRRTRKDIHIDRIVTPRSLDRLRGCVVTDAYVTPWPEDGPDINPVLDVLRRELVRTGNTDNIHWLS